MNYLLEVHLIKVNGNEREKVVAGAVKTEPGVEEDHAREWFWDIVKTAQGYVPYPPTPEDEIPY